MKKLLILALVLASLGCARVQNSSTAAGALFQAGSGSTQTNRGNPNVRVWVNLPSGIYHCPGDHWYGNTKSGEYMTQKEAQDKGYRPDHYRVCE